MSHFAVGVMIGDVGHLLGVERRGEADRQAKVLLAPYDENMPVDEYDRPCYCVGSLARDAAREEAARLHGSMGELRDSFPRIKGEDLDKEQERWVAHTAAHQAAYDAALAAHLLRDSADPRCEECKGTKTYRSTANPRATWDWWTIGGRWTGSADGYDPDADERNTEVCFLCFGSGNRGAFEEARSAGVSLPASTAPGEVYGWLRMQAVALDVKFAEENPGEGRPDSVQDEVDQAFARAELARRFAIGKKSARAVVEDALRDAVRSVLSDPGRVREGHLQASGHGPGGCNGCHGNGWSRTWRTAPHEGDVLPATRALDSFVPYAFVTADGEWHGKGSMGWCGISTGDKPEPDWASEWRAALDAHAESGGWLVVVDCHI